MREQGALLGHVADPPLLGRDVDALVLERRAAEHHLALLGALEAGDHAQQRRLAAPGGAEHGGQGPGLDDQVQPPQHRAPVVALPEVVDPQLAHRLASPAGGRLMRRLSRYAGTADTATIIAAYGAADP